MSESKARLARENRELRAKIARLEGPDWPTVERQIDQIERLTEQLADTLERERTTIIALRNALEKQRVLVLALSPFAMQAKPYYFPQSDRPVTITVTEGQLALALLAPLATTATVDGQHPGGENG